MNTENGKIIVVLCSHLCVGEGIVPFEPKEWSELAVKLQINNLEPKDILKLKDEEFVTYFNFDSVKVERIKRLLNRSASLFFEIEKLNKMGIKIVTRASKNYPQRLKTVLGKSCPPMFYYAGDLSLLNNKYIGFVGSRSVSKEDIEFTHNLITECVKNGYSIVTGGAKGVDSEATNKALEEGGSVVEFLSDSLIKKIKKSEFINKIRENKLLLLSVVKPDSGFNAGVAMQRNKYIYAQSKVTVVVKSDYETGGTWSGAIENLKNKWTIGCCWQNILYNGNKALINKGLHPIKNFNDLKIFIENNKKEKIIQNSFFD